MSKIERKFTSILLAVFLTASLIVAWWSVTREERSKSKILFEYGSGGAIAVADSIESVPFNVQTEETEYSMQIMFNYEPYSDVIYEMGHEGGESFVEYSKKYHTERNRNYLSDINTDNCDVFVSEYTPYIFLDCQDESTMETVYEQAESIAVHEFVNEVRIYSSDIYDLNLESEKILEEYSIIEDDFQNLVQNAGTISDDSEETVNENYPSGTVYTGVGVKIGLLDVGTFNPSHSNFSDIHAEIVYDDYDDGANNQHSTMVASVLGGRYGYAPGASIYYVDFNSDTGYVGIERLINKGCNIVNMSISSTSCNNNGEYDIGLEGYLDYIYTSTKLIMVAATSNKLDKVGTGGYVALPALCANVISVGSIDEYGVPSVFSSYKIKNDVNSNPNLVAIGTDRIITGFGTNNGTSFSTPAVTGAIALYFERNGVCELPEVLSALSASANKTVIDTEAQTIRMKDLSGAYVPSEDTITCTNNIKSNGSRERTGAGLLDVTALLHNVQTMTRSNMNLTSSDYITLATVYIAAGNTLQASLAWQRDATLTVDEFLWWETDRTYSSNALADFDFYLYNPQGVAVGFSTASSTNVENIQYTATASGYYTLKMKPYSNYTDTHKISYSYLVK